MEIKNKTFALLDILRSNPKRKYSKYLLVHEMQERGYSVREDWLKNILNESVNFGLIRSEIGTGENFLRKNVTYYTWK